MAGASLNDIKARIKSVEGTMQITKAMELVATSKLRRARENAEQTRPFSKVLKEASDTLLYIDDIKDHKIFQNKSINKTLYIVIAGDRGLAGGYNSNIFKLAETLKDGSEEYFLPIGKKALEHYTGKGKKIFSSSYGLLSDISVGDTIALGKSLYSAYMAEEFDNIVLVYTKFVSMLTQTPVYTQVLPLKRHQKEAEFHPETEEESDGLIEKVIPLYIGGEIFSALKEAIASETGARRSAMNSANKNAGEMIDALMLGYNRARQAVITQEITEIISGAEAL